MGATRLIQDALIEQGQLPAVRDVVLEGRSPEKPRASPSGPSRSQITEIITAGGHKAKKALIEDIEIQADASVIPNARELGPLEGRGLANVDLSI